MSLEQVLEIIESKKIRAVRFELTDMNGMAKSKIVPVDHFIEKATEGMYFVMGAILAFDVIGDRVKGVIFGENIGAADVRSVFSSAIFASLFLITLNFAPLMLRVLPMGSVFSNRVFLKSLPIKQTLLFGFPGIPRVFL